MISPAIVFITTAVVFCTGTCIIHGKRLTARVKIAAPHYRITDTPIAPVTPLVPTVLYNNYTAYALLYPAYSNTVPA